MMDVRKRAHQFVCNVPAAIMALCAVLLTSQALAGDSPPPWSARPLMNGAWQEASPEQVQSLVHKFRNHVSDDRQLLVDNIVRLRALSLTCYQDVVLFEGETRDQSGQVGVMAFLLHTKGVTLLDGKSEHLYKLNTANALAIQTREQAQTYLKFFAGAITSEEGNFRILETPQDLVWKDEKKDSYRDLLHKITPLEVAQNANGWKGTGMMQHGKLLFGFTLALTADGRVAMEDDHPDDHPIVDNLPIAITRYTDVLRHEEF
ncbi:MAG: hypothetical protein MRJ68_15195 [Nitrospira sp.]|nr:hypothetical protein [Nitrospira sp.]